MAKRDHSAFDAAVLAALKGAHCPACPTYVVRNCLDRAVRPRSTAPIVRALRRLEAAGKVKQSGTYSPGGYTYWDPAEPPE